MNTFKPYKDLAPAAITLDGTTQVAQLPKVAGSGDVIRVVVAGTATARVQPGTSPNGASGTVSNGALMIANSVETFTLDPQVSHVAVSGSAGSTVEIQMGTGL
jgi:hypothetical protein